MTNAFLKTSPWKFAVAATVVVGLAALPHLSGCGNPFRENNDPPIPTSGTASGTVYVPSTQTVAREAALSAEKPLAGAAVTLWRMSSAGTLAQITGASATTGADGAFLISGIPLNEANLILQARFTPASTGVPITLRTPLPELTAEDSFLDGATLNVESTFAAEGLRIATIVTGTSSSAGPKAAAEVDPDLVEAYLEKINDNLVDELNVQGTEVGVADVLTDDGALERELFEFMGEYDSVDDAYDRLKPATSSVSIPGTSATSSIAVSLSTDEDAAEIYFTTDGSTPTTDSQIYSSGITLSATTTLQFFAYDSDDNQETVHTEQYDISQ